MLVNFEKILNTVLLSVSTFIIRNFFKLSIFYRFIFFFQGDNFLPSAVISALYRRIAIAKFLTECVNYPRSTDCLKCKVDFYTKVSDINGHVLNYLTLRILPPTYLALCRFALNYIILLVFLLLFFVASPNEFLQLFIT